MQSLQVYISIFCLFFFFQCYGDHPDLHSFPTRRSSDLNSSTGALAIAWVNEWAGVTENWTVSAVGGSLARLDFVSSNYGLTHGRGLDRKSTRLNSSH